MPDIIITTSKRSKVRAPRFAVANDWRDPGASVEGKYTLEIAVEAQPIDAAGCANGRPDRLDPITLDPLTLAAADPRWAQAMGLIDILICEQLDLRAPTFGEVETTPPTPE
jgi:hypothetical protein